MEAAKTKTERSATPPVFNPKEATFGRNGKKIFDIVDEECETMRKSMVGSK